MPEVVLQTSGLTKRYGSLVAVNHLSLEVFQGEVFGFLGPNGAGKTTSINMMCGLLKPDEGQVLLHGRSMTSGDGVARSRVGVCPQEVVVWERLTCMEQLQFVGEMYGLKPGQARLRARQLLDDLGLVEKGNQQARFLSGGMRRRLNLLLALVHDPEIVVLDEPEAGLDPQSRLRVREVIQSLAQRKTVILTTHNMDEAERLADRVAIIDHGELLVLDTPEKLKQRLGVGDVVEVRLASAMGDLDKVKLALRGIVSDMIMDSANNALQVRAMTAVGRLPTILDALAENGFQPGEISIRTNTLEDVFIQLTGRRLRE